MSQHSRRILKHIALVSGISIYAFYTVHFLYGLPAGTIAGLVACGLMLALSLSGWLDKPPV